MTKNIIRGILSIIFFTALPLLFTILSASESACAFIWNLFNLKALFASETKCTILKEYFSIISILFSIIPLSYLSCAYTYKKHRMRTYIDKFLRMETKNLRNDIATITNTDKLNIRMFIPQNRFLVFLSNICFLKKIIPVCYKNKNLYICQCNTFELANNTVVLKVSPPNKRQGLVGESYFRKRHVFSEKAKDHIDTYNFTDRHKQLLKKTTLCITIPIISKYTIPYIFSIDSEENITLRIKNTDIHTDKDDDIIKIVERVESFVMQLNEMLLEERYKND